MYGSTQSKPKQGFVSFESVPSIEISLAGSYKKTLSKCCIDPLRPPALSEWSRSLSLTAGLVPSQPKQRREPQESAKTIDQLGAKPFT
jgi:hypothetical protein